MFLIRILAICVTLGATLLQANGEAVQPKADDNAINLEAGLGDKLLRGKLGLSLPVTVGTATDCSDSDPLYTCSKFGDFATLKQEHPAPSNNGCNVIEWESSYSRELMDCWTLDEGVYVYGGGETHTQYWPVNEVKKGRTPYITGDFVSGYGGVVENYWVFSNGVAIHIDEDTPLFVSFDTERPNALCLTAADQAPYKKRSNVTLKYQVCQGENVKSVHQTAMAKFYDKPVGIPEESMLRLPLWCTWAQYKSDINQEVVLEYARRIRSEGFDRNSHVEIDDKWEACYGNEEFDRERFPDPKAMVEEINSLGMNVTIWIHPFINFECPLFSTAVSSNYFVQTPKDKTGITNWWAGSNAGIIDSTNEEAMTWWMERLQKLKDDFGIASFKFDAGEALFLPHSENLKGDENFSPNLYTTKYVDAVSKFGGLVEVRAGRLNQKQPVFMRMLDKDSNWSYTNGLKSMIPSLLLIGILGYPFVLPDMIGGNAYNGDWPSKELYIRWMQLNVFMPSVQLSIIPWDEHYDAETIQITKKVLRLREQYEDEVMIAANQAVVDGSPINRPLWWVDPNDPATFTIDDEYMLGDKILVAPVLNEGEVSRDIYLPLGTWISGTTNLSHTGPIWLANYPAPMDTVPYFIKA